MATFLGELTTGLRCALEPLQNAFSNEAALSRFFSQFGWDVSVTPATLATIRAGFAIDAVVDAATAIARQIEAHPDDPALAKALLDAVIRIVDAVKALAAAPPVGLPFPLDQPAFWAEVPVTLADHLLLKMIEKQARPAYAVLRLLGLAEVTGEAPSAPGRIAFRKLVIRWERLPRVIGDPAALLREIYRWNSGPQPFDHPKLISVLEDFFHALRFPARLEATGPLAARYFTPANPALGSLRQLSVPLLSTANADRSSHAELGLLLMPIPPKGNPGQPPAGVLLTPLASGSFTSGGPSDAVFSLSVRGGFDLEGAFGAEIGPAGISLFATPGRTSVDAEIAIAARPPAPWILFGEPGGSRFEVGGLAAGVAVRGQLDSPEVIVSAGTGRGANPPKFGLVIQMSESDGFLGKVLGKQPIALQFGGVIVWESRTGKIYLEGAGGFETTIPLHLDFGVGELNGLSLALRADGTGLAFEAGVSAKAMLGPLSAVIENFGLRLFMNFAGADGKLGHLGVKLGFMPPKGIGLSIDAGVVKGGGYLFIDAERGEYAGALELSLFEVVTIKAIGLISTRMPDGTPGFSLLVIMSVEFGTGIQLGFGFTLLALGGLLGLNRTMNLQALADGIRSGAIESVMFPRDIIANAPKIISDLRAFFPVREGTFLIGPMVKLGWGTPTLVSLSLGIVVEIPGNVAIVGVLRVALPSKDAPLIILQVNFLGAIEFDKKRIWFYAALFESRVLFLTIEGEMGLLVAYGGDANFVVSVGGFHPRFAPPPLPFPSPRRISISLLSTPISRVRVEGYFAVTSNTAQFGARVEVFYGLDGLSAEGHLAFDALFQFSPFYFIIEISASFSVKVFGAGLFSVGISGALDGPGPWHLVGHGEISLLFWDIGVDFETTWGEVHRDTLPPIAVLPLLAAELAKPGNWRALLPVGNRLLVSLRKMPEAEVALILHPVGVLHISQRALPLEIKLDKLGTQKPADVNRLSVAVTGGGLTKKGDAYEPFAPAQFQDFSDADKLSRPAFAPERSGLDLSAAGDDRRSSTLARRIVRYEEIIIDNNFKRFQRSFRGYMGVLFAFFLDRSAVTRGELSHAVKKTLQPFEDRIAVRDETFAVALQADNKAFAADSVSFHSEASARDYMSRQVANDASMSDRLHVIPSTERAA